MGRCQKIGSPNTRGGVKILNFRGSLNVTLFYRDSMENSQFESRPSFPSTTFGASRPPPPLAFGTF